MLELLDELRDCGAVVSCMGSHTCTTTHTNAYRLERISTQKRRQHTHTRTRTHTHTHTHTLKHAHLSAHAHERGIQQKHKPTPGWLKPIGRQSGEANRIIWQVFQSGVAGRYPIWPIWPQCQSGIRSLNTQNEWRIFVQC